MTEQENDKLVNQAQLDAIVGGRVDYMSSYRINITDDECVCGTSKIPEALVATNGISATELFDIMADNVTNDKERSEYKNCIGRDRLLEAFSSGRKSVSFSHDYDMGGKQMRISTTVNMYQNPLNGDIEGIIYMYDVSSQHERRQVLSNIIGKHFASVGTINPKTRKLALLDQFIYMTDDMAGAALKEADYEPHIQFVADAFIVPDERKSYIDACSIETITDNLSKKDIYFFLVTSTGPDGKGRAIMKFTYYYVDEKKDIIISTMEDVTELVENAAAHGCR